MASMPQPHLDPETVAAFANRTLDARQRSRVFEHLVRCEACREWVAVHAEVVEPVTHHEVWDRASWLCSAAGVVLLCGVAWLLHRPEPIVVAVRVVKPAKTRTSVEQNHARLPVAWQQVRLTPELFPTPPDGHFVLKTVVGEKWIRFDGLLGSVVP